MRTAQMLTPTKGVRTLTEITEFEDRLGAFALALPDDCAFSHTTAARLWGIPLPRLLERDDDLHVARETHRSRIERGGCVSHRGLELRDVVEVQGVRVTSLADTWLDLVGGWHRRLELREAVMMGDATVELLQPTRRQPELHPLAPPGTNEWWHDPAAQGCFALLDRLWERRSFHGRPLAITAVEHVRPRVWSPAESYLRLVAGEAEVPEPELNASIWCPVTDRLIGYGDTVWGRRAPAPRLIGEYQGRSMDGIDVHTEEEASRAGDNDRCMLMRDAGWPVMELYTKDVYTAPGRRDLIRRLRSHLLGS